MLRKPTPRKRTDWITIMTTQTRSNIDLTAHQLFLRERHVGWFKPRWHYSILRCGSLKPGRDPDGAAMVCTEPGKAAIERNATTTMICLVGGKDDGVPNFHRSQLVTLKALLQELQGKYPDAQVECLEFNLEEVLKGIP